MSSSYRYWTNFAWYTSTRVNIIKEASIFYALLPYVCFLFLRWVKFCIGCFIQVFFSFGRQKKWSLVVLDRWSSYTVTIVWEFAWADSLLVVLDEWSSYRGGCLNRSDSNVIRFWFMPHPWLLLPQIYPL